MHGFPAYLLLTFLALSLSACREGPPAEVPMREEVAYDDSLYCFNGRSLVSREGRWGMVDTTGREILALEWDSADFLDDEVALLARSGIYYLCTWDGRIFAEDVDPDVLERSFRMRLSEMHAADYQDWNRALDRLEALCDACLAARSHRLDNRIIQENADLRELLAGIQGGMTLAQQNRLERIVDRFNTMYR